MKTVALGGQVLFLLSFALLFELNESHHFLLCLQA